MPILYNLTLQKPTAVVKAVVGNFSDSKRQEIALARGHTLELLQPDDQGKLNCIYSSEVYGIIRCLAPFRLTGASRDYLVLTSDSGRIVILEFNTNKNNFDRVHCETYGKSGNRRIVPGHFLAVDPKGRAIMLGALERQKFVYILNRDVKSNLTISSPLEAHKSHSICHDLIGIDVGFDNPIFASIEQGYGETQSDSKKYISFWEMDLGLNHVTKKVSIESDSTAHLLVPICGGADGPGGVLVCCENYLIYTKPDHPELYCAYPRRLECSQDSGILINSWVVHKMRDFFFILLQTEFGDLLKVELVSRDQNVSEIICRYFDTVPIANSLTVLKSGYLFVSSEFGSHCFYQFISLGGEETAACSSLHPDGIKAIVAYNPRSPKNLLLIDELNSLSPIVDMKIADSRGLDTSEIYLACGRGSRSTLRVLRPGVSVEELANNELPGRPKYVFSLKNKNSDDCDGYIVVAFEGNTLVLSVGEAVEEVPNSCFYTETTTLEARLMHDDSFIQIHEGGIRHVVDDSISEWKPPTSKRIRCCSINARQILIALNGGEVIYFEVDDSHSLVEIFRKKFGVDVTCMAIQQVPPDRVYASFGAISGLDNVVNLISLDRDKGLKQLSTQLLPNNATAESLCIALIDSLGHMRRNTSLFLIVGLNTGVMIRSNIDSVTGVLSDQHSRFLGAKAVRFSLVQVGDSMGFMAMSDRSWLCYSYQGKLFTSYVNYDTVEHVASFSSLHCKDGFVAISGNSLRIYRCLNLGQEFSQSVAQLTYTPRKIAIIPNLNPDNGKNAHMIAVVESDHNTFDELTRVEIKKGLENIIKEDVCNGVTDEEENQPELGLYKAGEGKWGSCVRIIDPTTLSTVAKLLLDTDEAAISCCACDLEGYRCLAVGTATGWNLSNSSFNSCHIRVYAYGPNFEITFLHSTRVSGIPRALLAYEGRLLAGVGPDIVLYSLGKRQLLRKAEYRGGVIDIEGYGVATPRTIGSGGLFGVLWLGASGNRIFAGDIRESITVLKFDEQLAKLSLVCDDIRPRWVTGATVLDHHTVAVVDKFDTFAVCRIPSEASASGLSNTMNAGALEAVMPTILGIGNKFELEAQFHLGDLATCMEKATLCSGCSEAIVYATVLGGIGALIPFASNDELDVLQHLELLMAVETPPLAGREHSVYRSYYGPVRHVIDGDLCEEYENLDTIIQNRIAGKIDKSVQEIIKKIRNIRNRLI